MNQQSAFWLDPVLVKRFVHGELDDEGQATLAGQVARLMPFHGELPNRLIKRLTELIDHLGSEAALIEWLDRFPGTPRKVARLLVFVGLLDRMTSERAVVTALEERRAAVTFPPILRRYLLPEITTTALGSIGWHIESLLAQDETDEAIRLALDTATLLAQIAPRAAELDPNLADLVDLVDRSRRDLLDVAERDRLFKDRRDAGRALAKLLGTYRGRDDVVVLGLPRGGVPVAYEVAIALDAVLDILLVGKLGLPQRPEVAMGAIASDGVLSINDDVVRGFGISPEALWRAADEQAREVARNERIYRDGAVKATLAGQYVIIVDDGMATGASMRAAIRAARAQHPARLVVAVPAAPKSTCEELALEADEAICATTPSPFFAVGASYWDFTQTADEEVRDLLRIARRRRTPVFDEATEVQLLRTAAFPTNAGVPADDLLFDLVGDARLVLIGEASHGTHEFYAARARMTQRLIEKKGFRAVAVEADWPDAYRVNRYVRGIGEDASAEESLRGFQRFPHWMWRNADVLAFVGWLRDHNAMTGHKTGFYGLDLYSMHRSAEEVIAYLRTVDPSAAQRAAERYSCFDHVDGNGEQYGMAAAFGAGEPCERAALEQLADLQRHGMQYARRAGLLAEDELFYAKQNARLVVEAERYYRAMFTRRESSWNLRDQHMADTVDALAAHLGAPAKIVVWAHNSHVGDARATELSAGGEISVGQLLRERHPRQCRLIGFTTYSGTVTAAKDWGAPAERRNVRPALEASTEELLHMVGHKEFMLMSPHDEAAVVLAKARLHRAIGVIYRPETERRSHYLRTRIAEQFDAVIHIDETMAVEPLEHTALWDTGELPETYPHAV